MFHCVARPVDILLVDFPCVTQDGVLKKYNQLCKQVKKQQYAKWTIGTVVAASCLAAGAYAWSKNSALNSSVASNMSVELDQPVKAPMPLTSVELGDLGELVHETNTLLRSIREKNPSLLQEEQGFKWGNLISPLWWGKTWTGATKKIGKDILVLLGFSVAGSVVWSVGKKGFDFVDRQIDRLSFSSIEKRTLSLYNSTLRDFDKLGELILCQRQFGDSATLEYCLEKIKIDVGRIVENTEAILAFVQYQVECKKALPSTSEFITQRVNEFIYGLSEINFEDSPITTRILNTIRSVREILEQERMWIFGNLVDENA